MSAVVQTHELTKHFRHPFFSWVVRAKALNGLSLNIERGEVFGLLGPNGSGKSTAIKLILGLLFPTSGQVSVFGKDPSNVAVKERIGYLPEETYLYRYLDAEETLDFYGRLFGLGRQERRRRTEALLDLVGLRAARKRPVAEFSKGMRRRIGLAQCLINDPEFVILDEPTTGMDPIGTAEIKSLIRELRSKGKTVLLCSHLLSEVEDVCDRVTILFGGRVQVTGPVEELVRRERLTQVTAAMDSETLQAVEHLLRERLGPEAKLESGPVKERLEEIFLRTIAQAREDHQETSGAAAARGGLDFLSEAPGLLERLAAQGEPALARPKAEPVVVRTGDGVDRGLLSELGAEPTAASPGIEGLDSEAEISGGPDEGLLGRLVDGGV